MKSSFLSSFTRYPIVEILFALIAGVIGVLIDKSDQPVFSFVLYALSMIIGLVFRPIANRTPLGVCGVYFVIGFVLILAEIFYFWHVETAILDIFLLPLGLGILFATFGSVLHRISVQSPE
jgi:tryptophan-rich sensory protein